MYALSGLVVVVQGEAGAPAGRAALEGAEVLGVTLLGVHPGDGQGSGGVLSRAADLPFGAGGVGDEPCPAAGDAVGEGVPVEGAQALAAGVAVVGACDGEDFPHGRVGAEEEVSVFAELRDEQASVGEGDVVAGRDKRRLVHVVVGLRGGGDPPDPDAVQGGVELVAGAVDDRLGAQGACPCRDGCRVVFTDEQGQAVLGAARLGAHAAGDREPGQRKVGVVLQEAPADGDLPALSCTAPAAPAAVGRAPVTVD